MSKPRVFHSKTRTFDPWGVRYRASETTDWFPEWSEAYSHACTWARISHVLREATPRGES